MAKRVTRVKAPAQEITLQTQDDVAFAIKRIGDLEREQVRLATQQSDEKAAVDEKYTAQLNELKENVLPLRLAIQAYCESRRNVLTNDGKQKTAYFPTGEVQWRAKTPSVVVKGKDMVIEALQKLGLTQFLRVKTDINKEAVLADPSVANSVKGLSISSGVEEFIIKPNDEEVR